MCGLPFYLCEQRENDCSVVYEDCFYQTKLNDENLTKELEEVFYEV